MKKTVAYTLLLVVAAGLVGPKVIGTNTKGQIDTYVEAINENTLYDISWKAYESGWFDSKGTLHVKLKLPDFAAMESNGDNMAAAGEPLDLSFDVALTMQHGPVLTQQGTALGWTNWQAEVVKPEGLAAVLLWDETRPLYNISGQMDLLGNTHFGEQIPELTLKGEGGETVMTFTGYQSSGEVSGGHFTYSGNSKGASFTGEEGGFDIGEITFTGDFEADFAKMIAGDLYNTEASMTFASMKGAGVEGDFDLENLVFTATATVSEDGETADIKGGYAVDKVTAGDTRVTDAGIDIAIENYSAEFNRRYTQMVTQSMSAGGDEAAEAQIAALMLEALPFLLAEKPVLKLENLRFSLPEGSFKGSAQMQLDGATELPADPANPTFWLDHLVVSASLAADNALAERLAVQAAKMQLSNNAPPETPPEQLAEAAQQQGPMMLGMLGQQGMLVQEEGQYRFAFSYDKGKTVLNGNPIDLPIGAMLGAGAQ